MGWTVATSTSSPARPWPTWAPGLRSTTARCRSRRPPVTH